MIDTFVFRSALGLDLPIGLLHRDSCHIMQCDGNGCALPAGHCDCGAVRTMQIAEDRDYVRIKDGMMDGNPETRLARLQGRVLQETRSVWLSVEA